MNKTKFYACFLLLFLTCNNVFAQDCRDRKKYEQAMFRADSSILAGDYALAQNFYNAAKVYCKDENDRIDKAKDELFGLINGLKIRADSIGDANLRQARRAYANDLAYKSKIALKDGYQNTAFRLAEFGHIFAEDNNPNIIQAMIDALYYNDNPKNQTIPPIIKIEDHSENMTNFVFSSNGKELISCSQNGTIKSWDLSKIKYLYPESYDSINIIELHETEYNEVFANACIRDEQIWALDSFYTWDSIISLSTINQLAFSKNGKKLASLADDKVEIWDLQSGKKVKSLETELFTKNSVTEIALSPNGDKLSTMHTDGRIQIWNLIDGNSIDTLKRVFYNSEDIASLKFSPDGKRLFAQSKNNSLWIWDLKNHKTLFDHALINAVVSFSGRKVATLINDSTVVLWNLDSMKILNRISINSSQTYFFALSNDENKLATVSESSSEPSTINLWDLYTNRIILSFINSSGKIIFSPDGEKLAIVSGDGKIWIRYLKKVTAALSLREKSNSEILSISFSPDGKNLAAGTGSSLFNEPSAIVWDLNSCKRIKTFGGYASGEGLVCVSYSSDGNELATGCSSYVAKIWDLKSDKCLVPISYQYDIQSVAFSPNFKRIALGSSMSYDARVANLDSMKIYGTFDCRDYGVKSVDFSPDGKFFAAGNQVGAKVWELETKKLLDGLEEISDPVKKVEFLPLGTTLATIFYDGKLVIWDLANRKSLTTIAEPNSEIKCMAFSKNGRLCAVGLSNNKISIWDLENGKKWVTLQGSNQKINALAFSPDCKKLATGADDGTIQIWNFIGDSLIHRWNELFGESTLSKLELQEYYLYDLLSLHPDNVEKLISTHQFWLIKAFAEISTEQASFINDLKKSELIYYIAERLYEELLKMSDDYTTKKEYAKMLSHWAHTCQVNGLGSRANELETKAYEIWPALRDSTSPPEAAPANH